MSLPYELNTRDHLLILVVDDHEEDRIYAKNLIESNGHQCDEARNGQEAVTSVFKTSYDIIFMDLDMPKMDGFEATRTIKRLEDSRGSLPIVALTMTDNPEDVRRCFQVGMSNFILKPLTNSNFIAAIQLYLQKKKKERQKFIK